MQVEKYDTFTDPVALSLIVGISVLYLRTEIQCTHTLDFDNDYEMGVKTSKQARSQIKLLFELIKAFQLKKREPLD